ncbi:cytochrome P450 [Actinomadura sp. 6K520]|uniref:cytochrome P450 n=1 Tax=Actinomadura sp. 6K520 TaxID=2530364 RepID=UPI0010428FD3|nr:cytochrome P450 [Actinomadura sp. 6K520]TDE32830.1 cytochrome P450 [Actinomadura sp. 6K520]
MSGGTNAALGPDLGEIDLFDPGFHATGDPHAVWALLRRRAPLYRQTTVDSRAFWSVTRYHDVCRVLGDHRAFTSERGSILTQLGHDDVSAGQMLVSTDPPRHGELRRPLNRRLSPRLLAAWEDRIRRAMREFLRPGLDGGVWDIAERSRRLPMTVAGALMGLPEDDWNDLTQWTGMAAAPDDCAFRVGSEGATLAIAHHRLFEYFARHLRRRRPDEPSDDLIGHLMTMTAGDAPLTDEEVIYNCYSILLGANATTPHTVSGTLLALMENPEGFRRVAADRALIPSLVEEGLRWTSPASSFLRHAVSDVEIAGGVVRAGEAITAWVGSANRDEDVFADAQRFDVGRADNRHVSFGYGPHYCLGAGLARMTFRLLFEEFFSSFSAVEAAGSAERLRSVFISGLRHLPVRAYRQ